jgi:FlaA1/EpsC-like NDP-sugar epimerase
MNVFALSQRKKRFIALTLDMMATIIALSSANWLSFVHLLRNLNFYTIIILILTQSFIFFMTGMYRGIWRFTSIPDLLRIFFASILGVLICNLVFVFYSQPSILHFSMPAILHFSIVYGLLLVSILCGTRLLYRWSYDSQIIFLNGKRVLIIGAGSAGDSLIRDLRRSRSTYKYKPVAIVDDNLNKQGCDIQGIRVIGTTKEIPIITRKLNIQLILIAIPSANSTQMRTIVAYCEQSKIPFKTLPALRGLSDYDIKTSILREIQLEDLLGREEIAYEVNSIQKLIDGKTILVTGGGGSIGSELCRQISKYKPHHLIIIDNNEYNLYAIDIELKNKFPSLVFHSYLSCVTDRIEMQSIFKKHRPELVFHVAAYKHVPLLETHVRKAIFNNIIGTQITAELADEFKVKSFVLISTDKAVNPTNIMGSTKRAAELFCQALNQVSSTDYITVRFGNVLDSTGSVIPLFRKQIAEGGPLTVTHPEIVRYFMTIPEAAQLILQSVTITTKGDIFVLDMGEPIKIRYLAEQMIKLSGKKLGENIQIIYTGLRPGEKLYEELFYENERLSETDCHKIKQARSHYYDFIELKEILKEMLNAYYAQDESKLRALLFRMVPEYQVKKIKNLEEKNKIKILQYEDSSTPVVEL